MRRDTTKRDATRTRRNARQRNATQREATRCDATYRSYLTRTSTYTQGVLNAPSEARRYACAIVPTHDGLRVRVCTRVEQSNPPMVYRTGATAGAKKFRGVTTAYRVTEGRGAFVGERRDVEFQWRIKMRCLDENEKISGHGRTDGGHLNCNFQCEFYTRDRVSVMYAHLKTFHVCTVVYVYCAPRARVSPDNAPRKTSVLRNLDRICRAIPSD